MKIAVVIIDTITSYLFALLFAIIASLMLLALASSKRKKRSGGKVNRFSFVIADLMSDACPALKEEVLLGDYIYKDYSIYLDYHNAIDRFKNIDDRIYIYSIAAHPNWGLYKAGFHKVNMLLVELKILITAFSIILKGSINFVKAHDPHMLGLNGLIMARLFRLPCVLHVNSNFDTKYIGTGKTSSSIFMSRGIERLFESFIINSCDLIMADRNFYKAARHFPKRSLGKYKAFGVRVGRIHYSELSSRRDMRRELGLEGKKILLYIGRLHPVKYPEDVIKAFSIIKSRIRDSALLIVGTGVLRENLEEMVRSQHLENSVLFLGVKRDEELLNLLYTADLLLAPHGGVTLVESALASTPIVAYDFDWHPEFMENGKMGCLVPFRDAAKMAEKALDILRDEKRMEETKAYCRKAALSKCSREISIANERRIYEILTNA